jgi:hypothetical protein
LYSTQSEKFGVGYLGREKKARWTINLSIRGFSQIQIRAVQQTGRREKIRPVKINLHLAPSGSFDFFRLSA